MRLTGKTGLLALALLASACVVVARPHPLPPPPVLPAQEAVNRATWYARHHGLVIDYTSAAHLDGRARWHVDLGGAGGRDRALVVLDAYSGRVLHARLWGPRGEMVPEPPPAGAPPSGPPASLSPGEPTSPGPPPEGMPPPPPGSIPPPAPDAPR